MPLTPPLRPTEFLPRSFTLRVMSTVLDCGLRLMSAASSFFSEDFAADHCIASRGVAREIDTPDKELLAFVGGQREIDLVAEVIGWMEIRLRDEIDIAELAVQLAHV